MAKQFKATLVRGMCYYLGNKRFDANKPVTVTQAERDHLESTAIDHFNAGGEAFEKQKFDFEEITEEAEAEADAGAGEGEDGGSTTKQSTRKRSTAKSK